MFSSLGYLLFVAYIEVVKGVRRARKPYSLFTEITGFYTSRHD